MFIGPLSSKGHNYKAKQYEESKSIQYSSIISSMMPQVMESRIAEATFGNPWLCHFLQGILKNKLEPELWTNRFAFRSLVIWDRGKLGSFGTTFRITGKFERWSLYIYIWIIWYCIWSFSITELHLTFNQTAWSPSWRWLQSASCCNLLHGSFPMMATGSHWIPDSRYCQTTTQIAQYTYGNADKNGARGTDGPVYRHP